MPFLSGQVQAINFSLQISLADFFAGDQILYWHVPLGDFALMDGVIVIVIYRLVQMILQLFDVLREPLS